jgi:predicted phage terminase large subunit-like protein
VGESRIEPLATAICGYDFPAHFAEWEQLLETHRRLLLIASRDHGKSTLLSKLYPMMRAITTHGLEILVVSYSEKQVHKLMVGMTDLFEKKRLISTLVPAYREEDWSKQAFKLRNGSRVDSLTFGTSGRGGHYDLILVDDPVKDYGGMDPDEQEDYFLRALVPMCKPDGQIVVTGTFVYEMDLIERLRANKAYHVAEYPAIHPLTKQALWPTRWPIDKLMERKAEVGEYGFAREYLLERLSPGTQFFQKHMIKTYDPAKLPERLARVMSVDPAISLNGDATGMIVTGTASKEDGGRTYLLDHAKLRTDDVQAIVDKVFEMVVRHGVTWLQVETIGFQKMLMHWLYEGMRERNVHFGVEEIRSHKTTKQARIMALQPKIAAGTLLFHPESQRDVVGELLAFPHGLHDDLIDALCMQVGRWDRPEAPTRDAPKNSFEWWREQAHKPTSEGWYAELNT